eukprot:COSAG03_NODE_1410_length_4135_cov_2.523290_1_plen_52_part_10
MSSAVAEFSNMKNNIDACEVRLSFVLHARTHARTHAHTHTHTSAQEERKTET